MFQASLKIPAVWIELVPTWHFKIISKVSYLTPRCGTRRLFMAVLYSICLSSPIILQFLQVFV
ncbi:hypothetical protein BDR03DRAFT_963896 [Suillus americanus]|nr:hypothetical protein BDR03DRAFT_963896 [Suillus americanus]